MGGLLALPAVIASSISLLTNKGVIFWASYTFSYLYLWVVQRIKRRRLNLYDPFADGKPELNGFYLPQLEWKLENPQDNSTLRKNVDDAYFFGTNSNLDILSININRMQNGEMQCSLLFRLPDGRTYTLPEEHLSQPKSNEPHVFGSPRMKLQCLLPMRKWRIFFNGVLKEQSGDKKTSEQYKHVKMTFLWTASSDIFDGTSDISKKVIAEAFASSTRLTSLPVFLLQRLKNIFNYYEQPGMILGTYKIGDEDEKELYLWGIRGRYLGRKCEVKNSEILQIYGHFKNGSLLHLEILSIPGILSRFIHGYVMRADGFIHPIEDCTEVQLEKKLRFSFFCGYSKYLFGVDKQSDSVKFEKEFSGETSVYQAKMFLNGMDGRGLVFEGALKTLPKSTIPKITVSFPSSCAHPNRQGVVCVAFHDVCCQNSDMTGGKGSSLGKLYSIHKESTSAGMKSTAALFEVPLGVVVTTEAYNAFTRGSLQTELHNFEKAIWRDPGSEVNSLCQKIMKKVTDTALPKSVIDAISGELELLFGSSWKEVKFAVRSSATGEDTEQMSAAGQMETFLGVKGIDQILTFLKQCWASQFSFHAVQYKRRYGQRIDMPMAVVIQQMVACEVSGVLFTCDPINGNPMFLSISANWGLGESTVSASAEPDTIVLERDVHNKLKFHSEQIGSKKKKIIMDDRSGTREEDVGTDASICCLSQSMALRLGELSIKIEKEFGTPRDIEWGIVNGKIFLFQSRPVTSLDLETEFEGKHILDTYIRNEREYSTKANVGEVMPGSISPLGSDMMQKMSETSFPRQGISQWMGDAGPLVPYYQKMVNYSSTHTFITLIDGLLRFSEEGSNYNQGMMIAILGRTLDNKEIFQMAAERHKVPGKHEHFPLIVQAHAILMMFLAGFLCKREVKKAGHLNIKFNKKQEAEEVLHQIGCNYTQYCGIINSHMKCTVSSSAWNLALLNLLAKLEGEFDNVVYSDFAYLLSTCKDVESADVPAALQNLGCTITECIDLKTFKEMDTEEALKWLQTTSSKAGVQFKEFLEKHGHRCLKEFDIFSKTWGLNPAPLVKTLQNIVNSDIQKTKAKEIPSFKAILSHMHVKLDFTSRLILRFLLPNCRRGVREREFSKSNMVKAVHKYRVPLHRVAELMVEEGYLPNKNLFFFLYIEEIRELLRTRNPRILTRAHNRHKHYDELEKLMFPEIICGIPKPINTEYEDYTPVDGALVMKGFPVSQGVVKATARVVETLNKAVTIQPGDILITYSTDIGWSPYFPLLAGVVTELGGLISHGAVISREYGLPCVVGLHGAMRAFKSGDTVILDGNKGTLTRIEK